MRNKVLSGIGNGLGLGLGLGIALGASAVVGGGLRPVAKGAVKGGLWAKEHFSLLAAEAREQAEDIYVEAVMERAADQARLNGESVILAGSNGHTKAQTAAPRQR